MARPTIVLSIVATGSMLLPHAATAQGWDPKSEIAEPDMFKAAPFRGILPRRVDLSPRLPPPRSQGPSNTCASWAVTYAAASMFHRQRDASHPELTLSPAFSYGFVSGEPHCMGLSSMSGTLDALRSVGALPLELYAFDPGWCGRRPTDDERMRAARYRIAGWAAVDAADLEAVKARLAGESAVMFGMPVGPRFARHRSGETFDVVEGGPDTQGHAMVAIGYDDGRQAFLVQNSSGLDWGDGGRFWLSYRVWRLQVRHAFVIED